MKFAVLTPNVSMFERLRQHFLDASVECIQFEDDVALARGLYRDDYRVILVDAATGIDGTRTVFARRAFYGGRRAPLLVVGTFTDRDSLERAFDTGADDVVLAPFDRNELAARAFRAMRRVEAEPAPRDEQRVTLGAYTLDQQASTVQIAGRNVRVTTREFAIAWLLFSRAGEYVTRRQLAGAIWGSTEDIVGRRLEQHIYKLRRKLELTGESGVALRTMYAHGYRIEQTDGVAIDADAEAARHALAEAQLDSLGVRTPAAGAACAPQPCGGLPLPADRANVVTPGAVATVHARHSLTASLAQPWASYANPWHIGATMIAKAVHDDGAAAGQPLRVPTLSGSCSEG
ncbi:putative response regulator transcription regulator protein [Burkholderia glumae BGR1]|uniref:Response regulator transcription factor n=2 Tax=Burkholderia glumae TaxID=337 RepID=A0AAP9XY89_BURGL|nr:putative response regulator transcription regulator protein [Burkholderia glumae BGR1]AJY63374.1 response regulator [Burkholderia glumae LMG 2196 = ATCC 33617]KHJ63671.1 transcriptional regulator [Burkholderia glumae]MCR1769213.1 response regulator transcription factor [Burkholderia glumae]NVE25998.1 response regulator transcription factor [Burkholderia glumae]